MTYLVARGTEPVIIKEMPSLEAEQPTKLRA